MHTLLRQLLALVKTSASDETAQNLVEYALIVASIAFGSMAGMHALANGVSNALNHVSSALSAAL
jgi:Flp pilus assembly pilin Flp